MNAWRLVVGSVAAVLLGGFAWAQEAAPTGPEKPLDPGTVIAQQPTPTRPNQPTAPTPPRTGAQPDRTTTPRQPTGTDTARSSTDQATNTDTDVAPAGDIPNMMGDFPGRSGFRIINLPRVDTRQLTTTTVILQNGVPVEVITQTRDQVVTSFDKVGIRVPVASRTYKVSENESPRPGDRVYFMFNYFDDMFGAVNRQVGNIGAFDQHREGIGFEKTFLNGWSSIGMRLPVSTIWSNSVLPELQETDPELGDLTMIFKVSPYYDPRTQNVFTFGLAVSLPTAQGVSEPFNSTALQPFIGWIWTFGDLYFQGFTAVDVPTDSNDVTLLFNDIGVGYWIYRTVRPDSVVTGVAPTLEAHINNPLNHRGAFDFLDPAGTADWVSITVGTTFQFYGRSTLALGGNMPVTGPKPYDFEILCQLNWYF